jgi:ATP-dependent Clp protease ATP-binding subunit ClpC
MQLLDQQFRPECLNRIDEIIIFRGRGRAPLREITGPLSEQTRRRPRRPDKRFRRDRSLDRAERGRRRER